MQASLTEAGVSQIIEKHGKEARKLISILLDIEEASGRNFVDEPWVALVSRELNVPLSKVYDVLTFYAMFSTKPRGEFVIEICKSTPCHFNKAEQVVDWFKQALGIEVGESTLDGKFTLIRTSCVGACDVGPAVKIGNDVYGNLTREKVDILVKSYKQALPELREEFLCQN